MTIPTLPDSIYKLFLLMFFGLVALIVYVHGFRVDEQSQQMVKLKEFTVDLQASTASARRSDQRYEQQSLALKRLVKSGGIAPEVLKEAQLLNLRRSNDDFQRIQELERQIAVQKLRVETSASRVIKWDAWTWGSILFLALITCWIGVFGWLNQHSLQREIAIAQALESLSKVDQATFEKHSERLRRETSLADLFQVLLMWRKTRTLNKQLSDQLEAMEAALTEVKQVAADAASVLHSVRASRSQQSEDGPIEDNS